MSRSLEVLVVGGGPGGAATGYWLARAGLNVLVVEKKRYPREKTCGDGLTPRAILQLMEMGFNFDVPVLHRINGLRAYAGDVTIEVPWPRHTKYPNWGAVIRRSDLDQQVVRLAEEQGATIQDNTEAHAIVEDGRLVGTQLRVKEADGTVRTETVNPTVTVIADGSLSRFGRSVGVERRRDYPYGMALRAYYASPNSTDDMLESQLQIVGRDGKLRAGYGWVFPLGDGTINVGAGVVSTARGKVNTSDILESFVASLPEYWKVEESSQLTRPVGGKLPMAFSVGPRVGANWVAIGDAAGAVNPFNGEGIDYAYETGRIASGHIVDAVAAGDLTLLQGYETAIAAEYSDYHRVARVFAKVVGNPSMMKLLTTVGLRSRPLMEWTLKVMANLLEPEDLGMSERVYNAIERIVRTSTGP